MLQTQRHYADLLREIRERAPTHGALVAGEIAPWQRVARGLGPREALIEYLVGDSTSLAFVLTADTLITVDLRVGRRELARQVEFVRGLLDTLPDPAGDSLWRVPLRRLHGYLIAPIEATGRLTGVGRLVVVPHAELHYLPFAALLAAGARGRFLIERYELSPRAVGVRVAGPRGARRRHLQAGDVSRSRPIRARCRAPSARWRRSPGWAIPPARCFSARRPARTRSGGRRPTRRLLHLATNGVMNRAQPALLLRGAGAGQRGTTAGSRSTRSSA